jgi:tetratricopeptide (TPR) repeat protein
MMRVSYSTLVLTFLLIGMPQAGIGQSVNQNSAQKLLLEQALYWRSKGDSGRAAEAFTKLLLINPKDTGALYGMALSELDLNRVELAQSYIEKIKPIDSTGRYVALFEQDLRLRSPINRKLLEEARALQLSFKHDEALVAYKRVFANTEPLGQLGLDFYSNLGYSTGGFDAGRRSLERLVKESPEDQQAALLLAQLLAQNLETRAKAVEQFARLSQIPSVRTQTQNYWRQTLLWFVLPSVSQVPQFNAYLKAYPNDAEIRQMRDDASKRVDTAGAGGIESPLVTSGLIALERGNREQAEAAFSKRLLEAPNDPNALGGLGVIRLQQNKLDAAAQFLSRAVAQPEGQAWGTALSSVRALQRTEEANAAQLDGDLVRARNLFEQAARLDPKQSGARLAVAALQVEAGEYEAAEKTYRIILAQNKKDAQALSGLIGVLAMNNKLAAAQQLMQSVTPEQVGGMVQMNRLKAAYSIGLAHKALRRGDTALAITELESALKNDSENPWIRLELAQNYLKQGQSSKARALFDGLLLTQQTDASMLYASALFAMERQAWSTALELLERIPVKDRSAQIAALKVQIQIYSELKLATNLAQQDRQTEALALLAKSQPGASKTDELTAALAFAYADIGEPTQGLNFLRQALARSKEPGVELQLQYASLLLRTNQDVECSKVLTAVGARNLSVNEKKRFEDVLFAYSVRQADLLRERGDLSEATKRLAPLLAQRPTDLSVSAAQARLYVAAGDKDKALGVFKGLALRAPDSAQMQLNAAQIATQLKDNRLASEALQKALELAPDDSEVADAAARQYRDMGRIAKAEELFERAIALQQPPPTKSLEGSTSSTRRDVVDPLAGTQTTMATELDLIKQERAPELLLGLQSRNRNGASGNGKLSDIEVPVEMRLPLGDGKLSLTATSVSLNAGAIGTDFYSRSVFGSAATTAFDQLPGLAGTPQDQTARGVGWALGYKTRGLAADIGVTPVGFQFSNLTGGLKVDGMLDRADTLYYSVNVSSRPVVDSVLSFAGTRDNVTGQAWGGVMSTGVRVQLAKDLGAYGVSGSAGLFSLTGHDVASNTRVDANVSLYKNLIKTKDETLTFGVNAASMFYDKNLSNFTYGQGGYFSPQQYYALTLPLNWAQRNGDFSYKLSGSVGVQTFSQNASDYFPNNGDLQAAANAVMANALANGGGGSGVASFPATSSTGMVYNLMAAGEYQLNRYAYLGGLVQLDNASNYQQWGAGMYLRFSFYPRQGPVSIPLSPYVSPYGL